MRRNGEGYVNNGDVWRNGRGSVVAEWMGGAECRSRVVVRVCWSCGHTGGCRRESPGRRVKVLAGGVCGIVTRAVDIDGKR